MGGEFKLVALHLAGSFIRHLARGCNNVSVGELVQREELVFAHTGRVREPEGDISKALHQLHHRRSRGIIMPIIQVAAIASQLT